MVLRHKNQSGVILLLVILIVTALLSTSAIFGGLILRDIQQSRLIDQSMQAFYLAESGVERALYQVRHLEAVQPQDCRDLMIGGSSCDDATGFCSGTSVNCITADKGNLIWPKGNWAIAVKNEKEVAVNLRAGESVQIDLFNPYKTSESQTKIESFLIGTGDNSAATIYGELNNLTWLLGGNNFCALPAPAWPTISRNFVTINEEGTSGYLTAICDKDSLDCLGINPDCSYILRLSNNVFAEDSAAKVFKITIYKKASEVDPATDQLEIPSRLDISAKAIFGNSSQLVRAKTPMRPPLSGLYDFVIFSEQAIVK